MEQLETITAHYIVADISADRFQDSAWGIARPVSITRLWSGEEALVGSHAEVRILWSNESLNVQFICNQDQPLIVNAKPQLDQKTMGLWDRDVCEIFIGPFQDQPHRYFEFEAAPTGEWVELAVHFSETKRENDFEFESGMTVAASVSQDHVIIGMRIPWSTVIPKPQHGDEWHANLFRCVGLGNERYLAWQPTFTAEPNFHVPEAFGRLKFT